MKKLALIFVVAAMTFAGCINIMTRFTSHDTRPFPYDCTVESARMVAAPFVGHDGIDIASGVLLWPIWIINTPCEAVFDTLLLPFDWYRYHKYKESDFKRAFCDVTEEEKEEILGCKNEDFTVQESNKITTISFKDPDGKPMKVALVGCKVRSVQVTTYTNSVEQASK